LSHLVICPHNPHPHFLIGKTETLITNPYLLMPLATVLHSVVSRQGHACLNVLSQSNSLHLIRV